MYTKSNCDESLKVCWNLVKIVCWYSSWSVAKEEVTSQFYYWRIYSKTIVYFNTVFAKGIRVTAPGPEIHCSK